MSPAECHRKYLRDSHRLCPLPDQSEIKITCGPTYLDPCDRETRCDSAERKKISPIAKIAASEYFLSRVASVYPSSARDRCRLVSSIFRNYRSVKDPAKSLGRTTVNAASPRATWRHAFHVCEGPERLRTRLVPMRIRRGWNEEGKTATKDILGERFPLPFFPRLFFSLSLLSLRSPKRLRDHNGPALPVRRLWGLMPRTYGNGILSRGPCCGHIFCAPRSPRDFTSDRCFKRIIRALSRLIIISGLLITLPRIQANVSL